MRRSIAIMATTLSLAAGSVFTASYAEAVGGNCSAWSEKQNVSWAPDKWRVAARCSYLQADSKAKGVGDVDGPDHNTSWFTTLNTTRYSSWGIGAIDRSRVEITRV